MSRPALRNDSTRLAPALIVDPDSAFLESIRAQAGLHEVPAVLAEDASAAQACLAEPAARFSGIFVNPRVGGPAAVAVVRLAHLRHPATPIFFLLDEGAGAAAPSSWALNRIAVQGGVRKPLSYEQIVKLAAPVIATFDPQAALERTKLNADPAGQEVTAADCEFVPILARNFLAGHVSFFDLYFKTAPGQYVKLLQGGEAFDPERIARLIQKGLTHLHLRREAQETYLRYCDHLATALAARVGVPLEVKTAQALNAGEEVMNYLRAQGLNPDALEYAARFSTNVGKLAAQAALAGGGAIRRFVDDAAEYTHGVAVAFVVSLLLRPFRIESERLRRVIGTAALFHDIGLQDLPDPRGRDPQAYLESLTDAQRIAYWDHPLRGAELLEGAARGEPMLTQIVAQHHQRRSGRGFPSRVAPDMINPMAEVVGLADELVDLVVQASTQASTLRAAGSDAPDPLDQLIATKLDDFSYPVISAFRDIFVRKR